MEEIYSRLNGIFRDLFYDDTITVQAGTTAADVVGWDSLAHINLVLAIEEAFGIEFSMGEVSELHNVGEMVKLIQERAGS
jgi:acyl carrier protein